MIMRFKKLAKAEKVAAKMVGYNITIHKSFRLDENGNERFVIQCNRVKYLHEDGFVK